MAGKVVQGEFWPKENKTIADIKDINELHSVISANFRALFAKQYALAKQFTEAKQKFEARAEETESIIFNMNTRLSNLSESIYEKT